VGKPMCRLDLFNSVQKRCPSLHSVASFSPGLGTNHQYVTVRHQGKVPRLHTLCLWKIHCFWADGTVMSAPKGVLNTQKPRPSCSQPSKSWPNHSQRTQSCSNQTMRPQNAGLRKQHPTLVRHRLTMESLPHSILLLARHGGLQGGGGS